MAIDRAPAIDKCQQKHTFSVKMKPVQPDNSRSVEDGAVSPMTNQTSGKAEEMTLDEFNKQIFCTIEVKSCTWDASPALIVLIEDVTDKTQSEFTQMHTREKQLSEKERDAQNFKVNASHEMKTPIQMCILMLTNLIEVFQNMFLDET